MAQSVQQVGGRRGVRVGQVSRRGVLLGGLALAGGGLLAGGLGLDPAWAVDGPTIVSCDGWGARPNRGSAAGVQPAAREDPRAPHGHREHRRDQPRRRRPARPVDPEVPHGPPRLARHRPALHGEPRRHRARGTAPQPGVRPGRAVAGRGRALHGPERRRAGHRERGHLQHGRPAACAVGEAAVAVRVPVRAVRHQAHRDLRAPRLQGHRLPRRPALRRTPAPAHRGRRGARAEAQEGDGEPGGLAAAAHRRPWAAGARRAAPPARRRGAGGRAGRPVHPRARRHRARLPGRARLRPGRLHEPVRGTHRHDRRRVVAGAGPPGAGRGGRRGAAGRRGPPARPRRAACPRSSPRRSGSACSPRSRRSRPALGATRESAQIGPRM